MESSWTISYAQHSPLWGPSFGAQKFRFYDLGSFILELVWRHFGEASKPRLTVFLSDGTSKTLVFFANRILKEVHFGLENRRHGVLGRGWEPCDRSGGVGV